MNTKLKIALAGVLFITMILLSAFVIADFVAAEDGGEAVDCMAEDDKRICYVLREYEGYVAIFVENDAARPITVTDIQTSTLRELDRKLLETGLKLYSHETLMMTLEDLSS